MADELNTRGAYWRLRRHVTRLFGGRRALTASHSASEKWRGRRVICTDDERPHDGLRSACLCTLHFDMDDELRGAVADVRAWAAREGGCMDDMTDVEILDAIRMAAASMPASTVNIVRDHGLRRLALVMERFAPTQSRSQQ